MCVHRSLRGELAGARQPGIPSRREDTAVEGYDEALSRAFSEPSTPLSLAARTFAAENHRTKGASARLRRAFQRYDRQMSYSAVELDFECESIAGLSGDERLRPGAT